MNWRLRWLLWLLVWVTVGIVSFGWLEHAGWVEGHTLSRAAAELPRYAVFVLGWITGGLTCGLAIHFWWPWAPPKSKSHR